MKFIKIKGKIKQRLKLVLPLTALALLAVFGIIGQSKVKAAGRKIPIYSVKREDKKVALSFDAAWGNEDTQILLETLDKYDVKVTFFMTGGWIESYPEDVKSIFAHGHDLGNHSEKHKHMSTISMRECEEELMGPHKKVQELTGYDMFLFRPPYGDYNNTLIEAADECGYYTIQWSVDTLVTRV